MSTLKPQFPSFGWKQILMARKEILDGFDRAREKARAQKVETFHGVVGEALIREWLTGFLPQRYGVTSGYVISPGFSSKQKAPHFDVIVYERLESPILWVDDSPDSSAQGRSLALPVEYVRCVFEVKSQWSSDTLRKAIEHLKELSPVMEGTDAPGERYKLHLPANFFCGVIFCDLNKEHASSRATLGSLMAGLGLRGFIGGLVLRGEGHTSPHTGRLIFINTATPAESTPTTDGTSLLEFGLTSTTPVAENIHVAAMLTWGESTFAEFAFDIVAMLQGTFEVGRLSSLYGVGNSWLELQRQIEGKE